MALTRGVGKANNHVVVSVKDTNPEVITSRPQKAAELLNLNSNEKQ